MRTRSCFLIALSILMIIGMISDYGTAAEKIDEKIDCRFLGVMFKNVLERLHANDYSVKNEINALVRINLPEPFKSKHVKVYNYLLNYLEGIEYINGEDVNKTPIEIVASLREFNNRFEEAVKAYMVQLGNCVNDQTIFSTLNSLTLIYVRGTIENIPILIELISMKTWTPHFISISLNKLLFTPGEILYANISTLEKEVILQNEFQIAHWPTLETIGKGLLLPQGGYYYGWFQIPSLDELSNRFDLKYLQDEINLVIIAKGSFNGSQVVGLKFFKLRLDKPQVYLAIDPPLAYLGDFLRVKIFSNGMYSGTLFLNNTFIASLNLTPGRHEVVLPLEPSNTSVGVVSVTLSVEMTESTLPANVTGSAIIIRKKIPLHIEAPIIVTTVYNTLRVRVCLEDPSPLPVKVSIVGPQRVEILSNTSQFIETEISYPWLPIINSEIDVIVTPANPVFDSFKERFTLFVVNPILTVIWAFSLTLAFMALKRRETVFIFYVKTLRSRGTIRQDAGKTTGVERFFETKSIVARKYYEVLNKLNIDPPRIAETLREHFTRIPLSIRLKEIMRKLLLLAERDLYGKIKPRVEEADELVNKVLNYESD